VRVAYTGACAPGLSLDDELGVVASAGYDGVELWLPKVWPALERPGPEALVALMKKRGLAAVALAPIAEATFRDAAGLETVAAQAHGAAALAARLGAAWVVVQPGERPDGADDRDAIREGQESLERLCRVGERYDVGLALMPLGFPWASIRTVQDAMAVLEGVGRRSLGLALDTFHFHVGGSSLDDLKRCRARWLALLRLSDAPAGERQALRDHHRLPPGEGTAPLRAIIGIVRGLGADPPVVVHAPIAAEQGDPTGWAVRLRERALAVLRAPELTHLR